MREANAGARVDHRVELRPILAARLASGTTADWLTAFGAAEVPAAPINDLVSAFDHPQARARGMTVEIDHPAFGTIRQVGLPFELSATPGSICTRRRRFLCSVYRIGP